MSIMHLISYLLVMEDISSELDAWKYFEILRYRRMKTGMNNFIVNANFCLLCQWLALADAAKEKSCHWKIILLKLSVLRADILSDGTGAEIAEIETLLEEAAEFVDAANPQDNPNYYR